MNIEDITKTCGRCKGEDSKKYTCYHCRSGKVLSEKGREFMELLAEWLWAHRGGDIEVKRDDPNADGEY